MNPALFSVTRKGKPCSLMARHKSVNPKYTKYEKSFASENSIKLLNINFRAMEINCQSVVCKGQRIRFEWVDSGWVEAI